jgi:transglutaminase-like putative cysteine protease
MLRRSAGRRIAAAAIVLLWVVMMALLLQREVLVPQWTPEAASVPAGPSETWLGIFLPGRERVGFVHSQTQHGRGDRTVRINAQCRLPILDTDNDIVVRGTAVVNDLEGLRSFDFTADASGQVLGMRGTIENGVLRAVFETGGEDIPFDMPVGDAVMLASNIGGAYSLPQLEVGEAVNVKTLDPMTFSMGEARVACVAEETLTIAGEQVKTKKLVSESWGTKSTLWATPSGEVVRAETPLGFTLEVVTPEVALTPIEGGSGADLLELVAVRPTGERPFRGAGLLEVSLSGLPEDVRPVESGSLRSIAPDRYRITRPEAPQDEAERESAPEAALADEPLVQRDHPLIQELSHALTEGAVGQWDRAQRIYEWVYRELDKTPVASVPSALEVLATREGDCNEHTVLYTSLARAAGVPTRMAIGVVWSDDLDGFYYHAWPEVAIGGAWIGIDPTLGQEVADATHIKFFDGGIETWPRLLPYLGQVEIHVLRVE